MTTRLQRFDFGSLRDFRGPIVVKQVEEEIVAPPPPPPPPTFSEADLEAATAAAKKLGFAEGFEAGLARAAEQADAKRDMAETRMLAMGESLRHLQESYQQLLVKESGELSQLVLMIARKVAGEALAERSHETISAFVGRCLPVIFSKPRLIVELNPDNFELTIDAIEKLLQKSGYEGEVQFRANPQLSTNDVALDWGIGQAERNTDALWHEIETLLTSMPLTITPPVTQPEATISEPPQPAA